MFKGGGYDFFSVAIIIVKFLGAFRKLIGLTLLYKNKLLKTYKRFFLILINEIIN